ncbi:hypothetical protein [Leucothrix pacifica]|uniref:Uncharacterized protein n=1 Tax=Leucothrix pacifica TaxID=1247513 RepID=A0A317C1D8_9GAMM|nr:hypothetical protein [Leucothrix pacifica]PWQ92435.1 hypothetical protein DKW60_21300 [Leucothrix pacifica]
MSDYKPPKNKKTNALHAVARSGLGAIPFAGTAAIEILNRIVAPPLEQRKEEWMLNFGNALLRLEKKQKLFLKTYLINISL